MQCAPKPVCPSQDQPVRTAASQWRTCVQDYPWASAWPISLNHAQASALQPMETHAALSLLDKQDRNAVSRDKQFGNSSRLKKTLPKFHQLASRISLRPRPSDTFHVQPGRDWTSGWATPRQQRESHDYQARILAGHYRTRRDTIKHSGQFSKATRRPVRDFQPLIKASSSSSTHGNGWSPTPTRRNNLNQGCVKAESLLELVPTSGNHSNSNFF